MLEKLWHKFLSVSGYGSFSWTELVLFIAIPIVCFIVEMLFVGYAKSSFKTLIDHFKSVKGDVFMFILEASHMFKMIGIFMTFGICYYLSGIIQRSGSFQWIQHINEPILLYTLLLLIGDFKNYVKHVLFHKIGAGWQLHSYHHSAERFTLLTFHRFHFVEHAIGMLIDVVPFVLLGAGVKEYVYIAILRETHQYLLHSQLTSDWGIIGKYILVSPAAHRLHHSSNPEHFDHNFGITFIFWDRIFGTYKETQEEVKLGIPNNPFDKKGFLHDVWYAYKGMVNHLIRPFTSIK